MPHLIRSLCVIAALLAGATAMPSLALAKKRVVVMPFSGRGASGVRSGFISSIRRRYRVLSPSGAQRRGGVRRMCRRLRCDAVVRGHVSGRRGRFRVVISIADARGRSLGRRATTVRGRRRLRRAGAAIGRRSMALLRRGGAVRRTPRPAPAPAPTPAPAPAPPVAQPVRPPVADEPLMATGNPRIPEKVKRRRRKKRESDDEDDEDDLEDDEKEVDASESAGPIKGGRGLIEASVAFGMASRTYELTDAQGARAGKYSGAYYPEFLLGLEFYPMTLTTRGWLSGLGLGVSYSRHLSISTEEKTTGNAIDTGTQEIQANLRYRWLINNSLSGPQVHGYVGWGYRAFDLSQNTILASFNYHYIHVGIGGRMLLGTPFLGVSVDASVRPPLRVGQEAVNAYGERGGAFGFSVKPGLYGYIWKLRYFAEFEFTSYSMDFKGLPPEDVEPGTIDLEQASDGSDVYIRTWIGVAYAY